MKKIFLLLLCVMPQILADDTEMVVHEQLDMQRKKEQKNTTLGDAARIITGSTCLVAAWVFYREARRGWIGLNDATLIERTATRIKELSFFKQLREKLDAGEPSVSDENAFNLLVQGKAALSSKVDIAENAVLAIGFTYFGFNLLAKGLHIIK